MRGFVHKRVHKRKDGKTSVLYYAVMETTVPGSSRRKRDWGKGYRTAKEAHTALRKRLEAFESQMFVPTRAITIEAYLGEWLPQMKDRIKPTTLDSYRRALDTYVIPRIGGLKLQELAPAHLNSLYADLRESGGTQFSKSKRGQKKPLSQKTVRNVHAILSKALNDAVDAGYLTFNVATRAKPPRPLAGSHSIEAWEWSELNRFLAFVKHDRLYAAWHLAAFTGMRRGELLGLRWKDVDFASGSLAVRQTLTLVYTTPTFLTPKSQDARVINLDDETIEVLREHAAKQAQEKLDWGEGYVESGLVFRREDGKLINPDRMSQLFDKFVRHSGVRRIKLHGLRHTHATLTLKEGEPVKVVSERLGHADPAFTLRIYQHVLSGMQAGLASRFAAKRQAELQAAVIDGEIVIPWLPPPAHPRGERPPDGKEQ